MFGANECEFNVFSGCYLQLMQHTSCKNAALGAWRGLGWTSTIRAAVAELKLGPSLRTHSVPPVYAAPGSAMVCN